MNQWLPFIYSNPNVLSSYSLSLSYSFIKLFFVGGRAEVFEARDVPRQQHSDSSSQPWSCNTGDQSDQFYAWGKEYHVKTQDRLYTGWHIGKMLNDEND